MVKEKQICFDTKDFVKLEFQYGLQEELKKNKEIEELQGIYSGWFNKKSDEQISWTNHMGNCKRHFRYKKDSGESSYVVA